MILLKKILKGAWYFIQKLPSNVLAIAIIAMSVVVIFGISKCSNPFQDIGKIDLIEKCTVIFGLKGVDNNLMPITCQITSGVDFEKMRRYEKWGLYKEVSLRIKGELTYDYYVNFYNFNMSYKNHAIYIEMEPLKLREPLAYRSLSYTTDGDWYIFAEPMRKTFNEIVKEGGELDQFYIEKGKKQLELAETLSKAPIEKYIREVILPLLQPQFAEPIDIKDVPIKVSFDFKPTGKSIELKGVGDIDITPAIKDATQPK